MVISPKTILLAADFDPTSERVAEAAVNLARAFSAQLAILHVLEATPDWDSCIHELRALIEERIREVARQVENQGVPVLEATVVGGSRAGGIFDKARQLKADLIVIGSGKISAHDRFLLGPVAETVLELALRPVLAVHPRTSASKFERILCPVDHSATSARGLRNAIRLAETFGAHLVVLSVVPEISWLAAMLGTGRVAGVLDEYRRQWVDQFEQFLRSFDFGNVSWEKEIREGMPHEQIIAAARAHRADLICMGSTGKTGWIRVLMGSVARHVLQELPCALFLVKDEGVTKGLETSGELGG